MTDSPTSQAMHLAMTELEHRREQIAELKEELAKERADARRYRWLRACGDEFDCLPILDLQGNIIPEALDAAIDAAMERVTQ